MGVLALILGLLGGLCAVMGIISAVEVIPALEVIPVLGALDWMFWLVLAGILFLACIAVSVARSGYEE